MIIKVFALNVKSIKSKEADTASYATNALIALIIIVLGLIIVLALIIFISFMLLYLPVGCIRGVLVSLLLGIWLRGARWRGMKKRIIARHFL